MSLVSGFQQVLRAQGLGKGFLLLFTGMGAAQVLVVAASPIISRVYNPQQFGALAVYTAVASILTIVAPLRYETAIPMPERDTEGAAVLLVACLAVLLTASMCAAGVYCIQTARAIPVYLSPAREYLWLIPVSMVTAGIQVVLMNWALRKRDYSLVARTRLWQSAAVVVTQISLGFMHVGALGLILGFIAGQAAGTGSLARAFWRGRASLERVTAADAVRLGKLYWRFPAHSAPAALMNSTTSSVPQLLLSGVFGASVAGSFSFSQIVFGAPSALLGQSLAQVYFAEVARNLYGDRTRIFLRFQQVTRTMFLAGLGLGALALTAPFWFPIVFGHQWNVAASYSQLLAPAMAVGLAFSPTTSFNVFGLNSWQLGWDFFRLVLLGITAWYIASHVASPMVAVVFFSAISSVGYVVVYYLNRKAHLLISNREAPQARTVATARSEG